MQHITTVIFDMDGLLINSEPFWRSTEIKVFAAVGVHLTDADCLQTMGMRFDEVVEFWRQQRPWTGKSNQQIIDEVLEEMEEVILHKAVFQKGAVDCVEFVKQKGYKTAIASSSAGKLIRACMQRLGANNLIDTYLSAEFLLHGKPHPQVFLDTAKMLGSLPMECIVLEDSLNGIIAAKAAQMTCIAVPEEENKKNPKFSIADYSCESLMDVMKLL